MKGIILAALLALSALGVSAQQTVIATTAPCVASVPQDVSSNIQFLSQTGNFEIQFDFTPSAAGNSGIIQIQAGQSIPSSPATTGWGLTRLETTITGAVLALNGGTFTSVNPFSYTAGVTYRVIEDVNMTAKTYNAYIGLASASLPSFTTLATNYAFQTGAAPTTSIGWMTWYQWLGTVNICNITILTYPSSPTAPHSVTVKWAASTVPKGAPPVTSYAVWRGAASAGPFTKLSTTTSAVLQYVDTTVTAGQAACYVVQGINSIGSSPDSTPAACVTVP